jgi:hypothetical protein
VTHSPATVRGLKILVSLDSSYPNRSELIAANLGNENIATCSRFCEDKIPCGFMRQSTVSAVFAVSGNIIDHTPGVETLHRVGVAYPTVRLPFNF